jgi:tetratricopeptide (TPR) repeat protein
LNPLADRYLYLPSIGFALGAGWLFAVRLPDWARRPDAGNWAGLVVTLLYFALLQSNLSIWKNDLELFTAAARSAPRSARMQQNLGSALLAEGRLEEAARALGRAIELDPTLTAAHVNLGALAERSGQRRAAIRHYRAAVESPAIAAERKLVDRACIRLGSLLLAQRDRRGVLELIEREKQRSPPSRCATELAQSLEN